MAMGKSVILGDRPPSFVSKATLAAELDISASTVDEWVRRGILPKPIRRGSSVRWCWADISASLSARTGTDEDQFMTGIENVG